MVFNVRDKKKLGFSTHAWKITIPKNMGRPGYEAIHCQHLYRGGEFCSRHSMVATASMEQCYQALVFVYLCITPVLNECAMVTSLAANSPLSLWHNWHSILVVLYAKVPSEWTSIMQSVHSTNSVTCVYMVQQCRTLRATLLWRSSGAIWRL